MKEKTTFCGRTAREWALLYAAEANECERLRNELEIATRNETMRKKSQKESRAKVLEKMRKDPSDRRHGTNYGRACGCECERCRAAKRDYDARRKARNA